jgi:hypothetical protein
VTEYSRENLLTMLRSPDPAERDDVAYFALADRIGSGAEDEDLVALGDEMALRLQDPEIQTRTMAALILAEVVERDLTSGRASTEAVLRWRDAFAAWYPAERDLRGWDERLGWLHAAAHGADALGRFGRSPRLGRDDLRGLLGTARERMLAPTRYVLRDQEEDRLGYALALVLLRSELDEGDSGPVPPFATNAMRTLRSLYLHCDRGFRLPEAMPGGASAEVARPVHDEALKQALADVLRLTWPALG